MHNPLQHALSALAFALLQSLWQVSVLGMLAALSFNAMWRSAARWRHTVGMAWMLAMLMFPVLSCICFATSAAAGGGVERSLPAAQAIAYSAAFGAVPSWTDWLRPCAALAYLAGALAMLALRWGGWQFLRTMEDRGTGAVPVRWIDRVEQLRAALGIARPVLLRAGEGIGTPFTAYLLRPIIWLPLGLLTKLPAEQVRALLTHELAHVRRLDWIWNLVQHLIESVLFIHPAMWWLSRRVREERELACDALATAVCGDPLALAEALASLRGGRPSPWPGLGLAAGASALRARIGHLVQAEALRPRHGRVAGLLLIAVCVGSMLAAAVPVPAALLVNMRVDESMAGVLTAGNYRDIRASYLFDANRDYRVELDQRGVRSERYREDGLDRPVDGRVRAWVAAMSAMHTGASDASGGGAGM